MAINKDEQVIRSMDSSYRKWLAEPYSSMNLYTLNRLLIDELPKIEENTKPTPVQQHALRLLVGMLHVSEEKNVGILMSEYQSIKRVIFARQWWRELLKMDERYLLASLIIGSNFKDNNLSTNLNAITAASVLSSQQIKPDGLMENHRELFSRYLFGDAWTALYLDDIDDDYQSVFKVVTQTMPPFVNNAKKDVGVNLPFDM